MLPPRPHFIRRTNLRSMLLSTAIVLSGLSIAQVRADDPPGAVPATPPAGAAAPAATPPATTPPAAPEGAAVPPAAPTPEAPATPAPAPSKDLKQAVRDFWHYGKVARYD